MDSCLSELSIEEIADIAALYELAREPNGMCESYEQILEEELKDMRESNVEDSLQRLLLSTQGPESM